MVARGTSCPLTHQAGHLLAQCINIAPVRAVTRNVEFVEESSALANIGVAHGKKCRCLLRGEQAGKAEEVGILGSYLCGMRASTVQHVCELGLRIECGELRQTGL